MSTILAQLKDIWDRLTIGGRIATIGGAIGTLALIGGLVYYGTQPNYGVLFTDLKPADAQSIIEKLKTANVPYSISDSGTTVSVPNDRVPELRLQMASEGALSGGHVGFDLFDKTSFGATDFAQQINYRRAIEGELAKTLEGLDEVESARVHITPRKESVYSEKEEGAKASVMVRVRQNKALSNERTEAVVSLIASSVEGLDPSNISVMDTSGRLLVAAGKGRDGSLGDAGAFREQLEAKQKFETENSARIIALLEPVVGDNRVRADVAADIDFSKIEQSEEKYDPKSQVIRSQQTSQEARTQPGSGANLAVGARSNNPATQPVPGAAAVPAAPVTPSGPNDQRTASTLNYEIDKIVKKTVGGGGRVNRMTVSVVVDHKTVGGVEVARTSDEIRQIQDLVSAAVGIDPNRGDSVVVQTMPFSKPEQETPGTASFLERNKQLIPNLTKYGILVLVAILLLLFVIRPAKKALKAASLQSQQQKQLTAGGEQAERRRSDGAARQLGNSSSSDLTQMMTVSEMEAQMNVNGEPALNRETERVETIRKQIAAQTLTDTETVVSTMRGWLREDA
ncbi:MAG: flagellar basal-body MS-ring/collar protein FliF [Pyrinomonadaceae bacterium]